MRRADRLTALAALAGARRDADLAQLAAVAVRLCGVLSARDQMDAALAREITVVQSDPELPILKVLDAHIILAERARGSLETQIARLAGEKEQQRHLCATSFGRADVLNRLRLQSKAPRQNR